jgi:c-di-GMP-binding flagellar brake protein YcgR
MIYFEKGMGHGIPLKKEDAVKEFEERRRYFRVNTHLPVRYQLKGHPTKFGHTLSRDISEGGIRLLLNEFLPPKTEVLLEMIVLGKIVDPLARVVWSQRIPHSDDYQIGLEFSEIDEIEREKLREYIVCRKAS